MSYQRMVASTREPQIHTWTVEDYHQLVKARLIGVNEPTELIAGQIIPQEPLSTPAHLSSIRLIQAMLQKRLGDRALVRSQRPVILGKHSEPKPDLAVVTGDASRYRYHNPTPVEIALIVEINDGALTIDCGFKAIEYAQSGIQDYWVMDLKRWQLHVFRDIAGGRYRTRWVFNPGERVSLLAFPDLTVGLRDPATLHFLTRKLKGHTHHAWSVSPLTVMVEPTAPSLEPVTALRSVTSLPPQPSLASWKDLAQTVEDPLVPVGVGLAWSPGTEVGSNGHGSVRAGDLPPPRS